MSMPSDPTQHPSIASLSLVSQSSTVNLQVMDQFAQMKTMLSSFLGPRQGTKRTAFCNYLVSKVEAFEEREFQMFINKAKKLLRPGQRKTTVSPSNLHFLGDPVQLQHMCKSRFSSYSNQHQLQGNRYSIFPKL